MLTPRPKHTAFRAFLLPFLLLAACGGEETTSVDGVAPSSEHAVLAGLPEAYVDAGGTLETTAREGLERTVVSMAKTAARTAPAATITIDYPLDESLFPPEFVPPTFLWHDAEAHADTWLVEIAFSAAGARPITVLVPGAPPPPGEIDLEAIAETNSLYEPTEYQAGARSWTPGDSLWAEIKRRSVEAPATLTFTGFASGDLDAPRSRGEVRITTSEDPVGAPVFYRDVPLMASVGEQGRIKPLGDLAIPIIAWRLRDVSQPDSKLVLKGMPSCGNCHSFSLDGETMGMDVDGPDGDKGMYAIADVAKHMVIDNDDIITWNSFRDKPPEHRTIGFASRISPDGAVVVSTVNEALYVSNFKDYRFLQVFYPTRGILAYHVRGREGIHRLPGADDAAYVHCNPVWSPDGKQLVFSRAPAFDPYPVSGEIAQYPNDPIEPQIRYDLYRMPFDDGKGGTPVPVEGASKNGMSNTFPKVSPDGKWIVYTKCKNGLLMRPDSRLWIVPFEGGEAREMRCNTRLMNSWHSFSPNGRWLVFSSKSNTPYTQAFLTHIDEDGNDSPAILVPNCTAANRAVNLPEFLNADIGAIDTIEVPAVNHHKYALDAQRHFKAKEFEQGRLALVKAIEKEPTFVRALISMSYALMQLGRCEEALPYLERAIGEDPRNPYALFNLGISCFETGRPYLSGRYLEKLLDVAPGFPDARKHLNRAHEAGERLHAEIKDCEREVARNAGTGRVRLQMADLYRRAGRLEDALEQLNLAVELDGDEPVLLANLSWLLATNRDESIRDGARAVKLARRAVEASGGKRPEPLYILAAALGEVGRHEDAVRTAERALALAKKSVPDLVSGIESRLVQHRKGLPIRAPADR